MSECNTYLKNLSLFLESYIKKTYAPDNKITHVINYTINEMTKFEHNSDHPCHSVFNELNIQNYFHYHTIVLGHHSRIKLESRNFNALCALNNVNIHLNDLINRIVK
jgi:hypothetical protein